MNKSYQFGGVLEPKNIIETFPIENLDSDGKPLHFSLEPIRKPSYIKEVLYRNPATIVFWSDGTKTVCKAQGGDEYSRETGLTICTLKKLIGSTALNKLYEDWLSEEDRITIRDIRNNYKD